MAEEKESVPSTPTSGTGFEIPDHHLSKVVPPRQSPSMGSRVWSHLNDNIRSSILVEIELLILTFCVGLQDAISFPDFHCFASNQTGNTVFLVLAMILPEADGDMFYTANIGIALGFFVASAWLTGQLGHLVGPRRRGWLIMCNLFQTALVLAAAALQYMNESSLSGVGFPLASRYGRLMERGGDTTTVTAAAGSSTAVDGARAPMTLWAIGLLATAAGSQVVQARSLKVTEITTAMATAAWVDLMIDPNFFGLRNRGRNRRAAFLAALVLGTLAGAFVFKTVGSPAALLVSGAGKLLVVGMYFFNPADREEKEKESGKSAV